MFVHVLSPHHLDTAYTYRVPEGMRLTRGAYVQVPFGNRVLPGVVWGEADAADEAKTKPITKVYDHLPLFSAHAHTLVERAAKYTLSPKGAVLKMCLPLANALEPPSSRERAPALPIYHHTPAALSEEQAAAAATLATGLDAGFSVTVLDGVTGSGKTEVYFDTIAKTLAAGKQALVLLPEIALSHLWLTRFETRFGVRPVVWHSATSPAAKKHAWRAIVSGEAKVVVGARSALFLPYANLGVIVVDEEHEATYKQEEGVMYHARDMAVLRASIEAVPIVLASATPSLETWAQVQRNKYQHITLPTRFSGMHLPEVTVIDMRTQRLDKGAFLAPPLKDAVATTMAKVEQALLFLNRRGYAPLLLCRSCGHRFECKQCSAWLVAHTKPARLQCHHCNHTEPHPTHCPACGKEETLHPVGPGIERIAEEAALAFPQARIAMLSSDVEDHTAMETTLKRMEAGEIDILIGTQMVAKGHHFPKLTLVGVVDADLGLEGADPRAVERAFQLLHQLGGRAGREQAGTVYIQTFAPTHPVMQALAAHDRDGLMTHEMRMRERAKLPPFARLANVLLDGADEMALHKEARRIAGLAPNHPKLRVLGPAPAPLYRLKNRFRVRLLLQAEKTLDLQTLVGAWLKDAKPASSIRIKVDVDPYSFM